MLAVPSRTAILLSAVAVAAAVLTGCGEQDDTPAATSSHRTAPQDDGQGHETSSRGMSLPSAHVHGVAVNPADGQTYMATHDGLFRMTAEPERVGPVIDLMGFTIAGPDHFYASGHPGPQVELPNPVGLIESRDGGKTWTALSRQGKSDFHALATSTAGLVGFDGALRASPDGSTWTELDPPVAPYGLATSPEGQALLITSQSGPFRSTDAGATWEPIAGAPLLQFVDWADSADLVVGVTPDGQVAVSADAGATWQVRGNVGGPPQALGVSGDSSDSLRVLVVDQAELLDSTDGGVTFSPFRPTS